MLADQYRMKSKLYRTNVLLVPLGDDFRWDNQKEIDNQFNNYFKLMDYMNAHPEMAIHVQFSTLGDYFEAVRSSTAPDRRNELVPNGFPMLTGDFFTYADRWVGLSESTRYHTHTTHTHTHHTHTHTHTPYTCTVYHLVVLCTIHYAHPHTTHTLTGRTTTGVDTTHHVHSTRTWTEFYRLISGGRGP